MSYLPPDTPFSLDITFCNNAGCPFNECRRHPENLKRFDSKAVISIANLCGVCRKYLYYLAENCT